MALRPRPNDEVDLHLQVVRADRDVDALALSPGPLDHRATADSGSPKKRRIRWSGLLAASSTRWTGTVSSARATTLELARRPGQHDHDAPVHLEHEARGGPRQSEGLGAFRIVACFRTPDSNSSYGRRNRSSPRTTPPISRSSADRGRARGRRPGQRLHGPVVVSRPEPAGGHDQAGAERLAKRRLEPVRPVAHDEDPLGLDPARAQLAGQERPVLVRASAADELAPSDEDDRCGRRAQAGSRSKAEDRNDAARRDHDRRRVAATGYLHDTPVHLEPEIAGPAHDDVHASLREADRRAGLQRAAIQLAAGGACWSSTHESPSAR